MIMSMITMTTIGYGDISAEDTISRVVLIVYLPTAVAALADLFFLDAPMTTPSASLYGPAALDFFAELERADAGNRNCCDCGKDSDNIFITSGIIF